MAIVWDEGTTMPNQLPRGIEQSASATATGPSDYNPSSRPTVTLSDLVAVDGAEDAEANIVDATSGSASGFVADVSTVDGNSVEVVAYHGDSAAADGSLPELDSGQDLSGHTIRVNGRGY